MCCNAGYEWCKGEKVVYEDGDLKYCIFHAPVGKKGVQEFEFNYLVESYVKKCSDSTTQCELSGAVFEWDISFKDSITEFSAAIQYSFHGAHFVGKVSFREVSFIGYVSFKCAFFYRPADFMQASFTRDAEFMEAHFCDSVRFNLATFNSGALFEECTFGGEASFQCTKFHRDAFFNNAVFLSEAEFKDAEFLNSDPNGSIASFSGAEFKHMAKFRVKKFDSAVDFSSSVFCKDAMFYGITFNNQTNFSTALFCEHADFSETVFGGNVVLFHTVFEGRANFTKCKFKGTADFREARLLESVFFNYAAFEQTVRFDELKGNIIHFFKTVFNGTVEFRNTAFSSLTSFEQTTFRKGVSFDFTVFDGDTCFSSAIFMKWVRFFEAKFSSDAFFEMARFEEWVVFNNVAFNGQAYFSKCKFQKGKFIGKTFYSELDKPDFSRVIVEDALKFSRVELSRALFSQTDLRPFDFSICDFKDIDQRYVLQEEKDRTDFLRNKGFRINDNGKKKIEGIEEQYRAMKVKCKDNGDEYKYSHWHTSEKEMMRLRSYPSTTWLLLKGYDLLSGYGENPIQALRVLLLICLAFFLALGILGMQTNPDAYAIGSVQGTTNVNLFEKLPDCSNVKLLFISTLQYLTFQKTNCLSPASLSAELARIAFQLLFLLQFTLLGFAVRNRMRR